MQESLACPRSFTPHPENRDDLVEIFTKSYPLNQLFINKVFTERYYGEYDNQDKDAYLCAWRIKLEWRLKQLLEQHNLYKYGVETQIAKECGLHRHTIGKFLRNQIQSPKLEVLEKICGWLIERGVPADILPGAMFGVKPSGLWRAISQSKKILICLGEYHLKGKMVTIPQISPSISRHDSVVSAKIIHFLYSDPVFGRIKRKPAEICQRCQ